MGDATALIEKLIFHLKNYSIPKSKFQKILDENTTITAYEIDKLRLQIVEMQSTIPADLTRVDLICLWCYEVIPIV